VFALFVHDMRVVFIFFLFFSASVFTSGARKAICLPSGDQAKLRRRASFGQSTTSPLSARMA